MLLYPEIEPTRSVRPMFPWFWARVFVPCEQFESGPTRSVPFAAPEILKVFTEDALAVPPANNGDTPLQRAATTSQVSACDCHLFQIDIWSPQVRLQQTATQFMGV